MSGRRKAAVGAVIVAAVAVGVVAACGRRGGETARTTQPAAVTPKPTARARWQAGEVVELTGTISPSRADARCSIRTKDGRSAHLRIKTAGRLKMGARLYVKGSVEYVHYPRPADYFNEKGGTNYGIQFPQTFCYINVTDFKILPEEGVR